MTFFTHDHVLKKPFAHSLHMIMCNYIAKEPHHKFATRHQLGVGFWQILKKSLLRIDTGPAVAWFWQILIKSWIRIDAGPARAWFWQILNKSLIRLDTRPAGAGSERFLIRAYKELTPAGAGLWKILNKNWHRTSRGRIQQILFKRLIRNDTGPAEAWIRQILSKSVMRLDMGPAGAE